MARDLGPCGIPACPKRAKASGYCMGQYGALWRADALRGSPEAKRAAVERYERMREVKCHKVAVSGVQRDEKLESAAFDLKWARQAYAAARGVPALIAWRQRIKDLEASIQQLSARPASAEAAVPQTGLGSPESCAGVSPVNGVPTAGRAEN